MCVLVGGGGEERWSRKKQGHGRLWKGVGMSGIHGAAVSALFKSSH